LIVVLGGVWVFSSFQSGMAEVKGLGPWPGPEVSPREVVAVDLSHLGLKVDQIQNARDEATWLDGRYREGVLATYEFGQTTAVAIWGLRYADEVVAGNAFDLALALSEDGCGVHTWASLGKSGVLQCGWSDGYDKLIWNENWIVVITAMEGTEFTPVVLVDKVRDAISAHWEGIAQP